MLCGGLVLLGQLLSVAAEQNFQPTGTRGDELSRVSRSPAFGKTNPDAVRVIRPIGIFRVRGVLQKARLLVIKNLDRVARHDFTHHQGPTVGIVQRRGIDEDRVLAAVVRPHAVRFFAKQDPVADLASSPPDCLAPVIQV